MKVLILILTIWAAGLGAAAQFAKVALILPELALIYPDAGAGLGFLVTLISLLGIIFGLVAGMLVKRIGLYGLMWRSLFFGSALSAVQAVGLAMDWPLWLMLVTRAFEGLSHLGVVVAAPTLIAIHAPDHWRNAAMTLWSTFFGVAFAVLAWIAVPVAIESGPVPIFLAHAVYMGLCGLVLLLLIPRDTPDRNAAPAFDWAQIKAQHIATYRSPRVAAPALGWVFYTFSFVALVTVLPGLVPPDVRAFVAGTMPLISIVVSLTIGVALLRLLPAVTVVWVGFALSACLAALMIPLGVSPLGCIVLLGAMGLVQGGSFAAIPQLNHTRADQAMASGAIAQTGNLGNVMGTPIMLAVLAGLGVTALLVLTVVIALAGAAVHLLLAARRRADPTT
ncbi:MFS transporter [Thalassococcus sp. BH17M4-6]|uniref:MFS transporter n=1 Tax=Thalassococcus sp. BH17M4-6 TaxID=3413148 RepID=UPI003BE25773